jgi:hypothetical protein
MICALYFVFVVGCCLGLLVYAGPPRHTIRLLA